MAHFILCFGVPNIQQTKVGCAEYSPNIDDKDFYWYWNVKELNKNFFCYLFMTCTLWGPIINCYKINLFSNLKWYISHYLGSVRDKFTSSKAIEKTVATCHSPNEHCCMLLKDIPPNLTKFKSLTASPWGMTN